MIMTPAALRQTLLDLEMSTADLAILLGVTRRSPQFWLAGGGPVPQAASLLLEALKEGLISFDWVEDKLVAGLQPPAQGAP